jgi:serine phosphatase RsbU (regulator of sigma subunit)
MEPLYDARPADLVQLGDQEALQRHFDAFNYRLLRAVALLFGLGAVGFALWSIAEGRYTALWLPAVNLVLLRVLFWWLQRAAPRARFQSVLIVFLVAQLALVVLYLPTVEEGLRILGFLAPLVLLPFRLRILPALAVFSLFGVGSMSLDLAGSWFGDRALAVPVVVLQGCMTLACLFINLALMRARYQSFMQQFQIESSRHRDRQRMREELDYARQIQLRMLPRGDPRLEDLDVSAISLPATEVGGDYWEYFRPSDHSLTIAIGDVAGHGVASGLLLSGIRSCLHLLKEERLGPQEILSRLDRMVRETTTRRMFITLAYAEFDWSRGQVRLASAGHPPLLHVDAAGEACEVGDGAPPLGTRLDATYSEQARSFAPGDVMALYTDGLTELMGQQPEPYGAERLIQRLLENRHKSGREIREAVLTDLWNFKGDTEQADDITLVVIKVPVARDQEPEAPETTAS